MSNNKDIIAGFLRYHAAFASIKGESQDVKRKVLLKSQSRSNNLDDTLSLRIHDPLWMLSRQMEMGEFKGNDAATALSVKCVVREYPMATEDPIEYTVERISAEMTPKVRVESALYFLKLAKKLGEKVDLKKLQKEFPLDSDYTKCSIKDQTVKEFSSAQNSNLSKFINAYRNKAFDGYKYFASLTSTSTSSAGKSELDRQYASWFKAQYISDGDGLWDIKKLGYEDTSRELKCKGELKTKRYTGGRLSWYSFDCDTSKVLKAAEPKERTIYSLPTLATYPGAPNKRLWQFEDHKVYIGNTGEAVSQGSALFMQFATMYSNDWMMIPLDAKLGSYLEVVSLEVCDTFGNRYTSKNINTSDKSATTYDQRWRMFNVAPEDLANGKELPGLLLPQVFADIVESQPIEEVHFLRDEMANMVWGVETVVPDGTGFPLDNTKHCTAVNDFISELNEKNISTALNMDSGAVLTFKRNKDDETEVASSQNSDYSYMIQNTVPLNYIPFVPQHIRIDGKTDSRETNLRRGKMPCFVYTAEQSENDFYVAVRPTSSMLECEFYGESNKKERPLTINEEEILQTGVKIVKTFQQGRWLNGKRFHWLGISKQLNEMDANSGLTYDKLKNK